MVTVKTKKYRDFQANQLRTLIVIKHRLEKIEISFEQGEYHIRGYSGGGWSESTKDLNLKSFIDVLNNNL